jgi:DNA-binding CsgD family transcriptional regulator
VVTAREVNVLVALGEYRRGADAAAAIGISYQTLRNTLGRLCLKLGVKTAIQAYHLLRLQEEDFDV